MYMTLQSFIDPYNRKNNIIQVKWTPQNAYFHRKTNMYDVQDASIEFHKRLTTIDGPTINCIIEDRISPSLTKDIEKIILNIVNAVREISGYHTSISSMTAFFKQDESGRLWLLYTTNISTRLRDNPCSNPPLNDRRITPRSPSPRFRMTVVDKHVGRVEREKTMFIGGVVDTKYKDTQQLCCTVCLGMFEIIQAMGRCFLCRLGGFWRKSNAGNVLTGSKPPMRLKFQLAKVISRKNFIQSW